MVNEDIIVKKTYYLYSRYGIKSVNVDEIALMLGISKKTLYTHIQSSSELIYKAVNYSVDIFYSDIEKIVDESEDLFITLCNFFAYIIKSIHKINPSFYYDLKKYYHEHYQYLIKLRDEKLYKFFKSLLEKGINEGLFRNDISGKYIFYNMIAKVTEHEDTLLAGNYGIIPNSAIYSLILNDIRGITTLTGHEQFDSRFEELQQIIHSWSVRNNLASKTI